MVQYRNSNTSPASRQIDRFVDLDLDFGLNSNTKDVDRLFDEEAIKRSVRNLILTNRNERFFRPNTSHLQFITERKLIVSPKDPHPSTEGHFEWANQLRNYIDANNLRTIT